MKKTLSKVVIVRFISSDIHSNPKDFPVMIRKLNDGTIKRDLGEIDPNSILGSTLYTCTNFFINNSQFDILDEKWYHIITSDELHN